MKHFNLLLILFAILLPASLNAQLYVNPNTGNDANSGTAASPKQSLRGALRALTVTNTTIYIQSGDYPYSTMTSNANRNLGFGPGQSVTSGINNAFLPGTIIEGEGCVYWHNSNDNGTGAQNSIMTVEAVNGFTIRNIHFLGWQGTLASIHFINCTNVKVENCVFHQDALSASGHALRLEGDASETAIGGTPSITYTIQSCIFQNNGNPSGQSTGEAVYIRNNGTSHLPPSTTDFTVNIFNSSFVCNYAATGGALYAEAVNNADEHPTVNVTACTFSGNKASSQGGAIFMKYSNLTTLNTGFCNNDAGSSLSDRDGGAIHIDQGASLVCEGCVFQDNIAGRYGAAINVTSNALSFSCNNSVFYSNNRGNSGSSVITDAKGGTVSNCLFKDNATTLGNAVGNTGSNAVITTMSNSTFSGNGGSSMTGTNLIDDHSLALGNYIDALGHAWSATETPLGFTGTYSTMPDCMSCPSVPAVGSCAANGGGILITSSSTSRICGDLNSDGTLLGGSITIDMVSGWTPPSCGMSTYRYYFLIIGEDGLIKKVISADDDNDGTPNFGESPVVATNLDLSGLIPGSFTVQGFYSSNGLAPVVGSTVTASLGLQTCASISSGVIAFKTCLALTGNVFNDANGLNDFGGGIVNGPGTNTGGGLYAVLVDANGNVVANSEVSALGQYAFSVYPNTNYSILLSATQGVVGMPAPLPSLPSTWINVGESNTTGIGNDGNANGTISVNVGSSNVNNINFGIDQQPVSTSYSTNIQTPPIGAVIPFNASLYPTVISPTAIDPESGVLSSSHTIVITSLPSNATLLYNGSSIVVGTPINVFDPALLTITMNTPGSTSTSFGFAYQDPASVQSLLNATYTISWAIPLPVNLVSFAGKKVDNGNNLLSWVVSEEANLLAYQVEKSSNGKDFINIGQIKASGENHYSFTDYAVLNSSNYYRLKCVDIDQQSFYSSIILLENRESNFNIQVFPNPAQSFVHVMLNSTKYKSFDLVDAHGNKTTFVVRPDEMYDISSLATGVYQVVVQGTSSVKFIKK